MLRQAPPILPILPILLLALGCSPDRTAASFQAEDVAEGHRFESGTPEEAVILWTANTQSLEVLDDDVRLDRRAAENIVAQRPFTTIDALDAVPWVGTVALDRLYAYGLEHAELEDPGPLDNDGLTLWAANTLSFDVLDDDVGLDSRAAENIVARRPFATVAELDAVPYVGVSALEKLLTYARANHTQDPGELPLRDVLMLRSANGLLINQLQYDLHWPRRAASALVGLRPHLSIEGLRGLDGVGEAEMLALEAFAVQQWGPIGKPSTETNYNWCPNDDNQEPNESPLRATPLLTDFEYRVDNQDPDWLELTVPAGETVRLRIDTNEPSIDAVLWSEGLEPLVVADNPRNDEVLAWTNDSVAAQTVYLEVVMGAFYGCSRYTITREFGPNPVEDCSDYRDNDLDGAADCNDSDCEDSPACQVSCPTDAFEPNDSAAEATPLSANGRIEGRTPHYDEDWFAIEVQPGDELLLTGAGFLTWYTVFDAAGIPVSYETHPYGAGYANLTATPQTFTVKIQNEVTTCQDYFLETTTRPALTCGEDGYTVVNGQAPVLVDGLDDEPLSTVPGEVDAIAVAVQPGEGLYVRASLPEAYGLLDLRLIDPQGNEASRGLTLFDEGVELAANDAMPGVWTVEARAFGNTPCAPYLLTVDAVPGPVVIEDAYEPNDDEDRSAIVFDQLEGAILGNDRDVYQVNVDAHTSARLEIRGPSNLTAHLYDPSWSGTDDGDFTDGVDVVTLHNSRSRPYTFFLVIATEGSTDANYSIERL